MSIQERILKYIDYKGIKPYRFSKDLGLSMGYLDKRGAIGTDKYLKIIEYYSDINPDWLLTGDGEMLKSDKPANNNESKADSSVREALLREMLQEKDTEIKALNREIGEKSNKIEALNDEMDELRERLRLNKKYNAALGKLPTPEQLPPIPTPLIAAEPMAKYGKYAK